MVPSAKRRDFSFLVILKPAELILKYPEIGISFAYIKRLNSPILGISLNGNT
jgi:hypothetical protein